MDPNQARSRGFSLIEVTIGLLILGILMVPAIALYQKYRQDHIRAANMNNPSDASKALLKYVVLYGRYPRPARPDVASENAAFGREVALPPGPPPPMSFPPCSPSSITVCRTTGSEQILIGVLPFADLGLPRELAFDGYGRRLTYAVKWTLTQPLAFPSITNEALTTGIHMTDMSGGDAPGTSGNNVHFAIIAHGEDGRGAFTNAAGVKFALCSGPGKDIENCNNDRVFNFNNNPIPCASCNTQAPQISLGRDASGNPLADYYDDYVVYETSSVGRGERWSRYAGTDDVVGRTGKPVQIGTCVPCPTCLPCPSAPTATLEVWGNVHAATAAQTDKLCADVSEGGCGSGNFNPSIIGKTTVSVPPSTGAVSYSSTGIRCGEDGTTSTDQPMIGIASSNEKCLSIGAGNTGFPPIAACPTGQAPVGIDASGGTLCATP